MQFGATFWTNFEENYCKCWTFITLETKMGFRPWILGRNHTSAPQIFDWGYIPQPSASYADAPAALGDSLAPLFRDMIDQGICCTNCFVSNLPACPVVAEYGQGEGVQSEFKEIAIGRLGKLIHLRGLCMI